jgi:hypothetical protein
MNQSVQLIIAILLLATAIGYLIFRFAIPKKKKAHGSCDNCGV